MTTKPIALRLRELVNPDEFVAVVPESVIHEAADRINQLERANNHSLEQLATLLANPAKPNWQPIESAPKDRRIMVADGKDGMAFVEWVSWAGGKYAYWGLVETGGYADDSRLDWDPTHWAERPEGPTP